MTKYAKEKKRLKAKLLRAKSTMAKLDAPVTESVKGPKVSQGERRTVNTGKVMTNMAVPPMHTVASMKKKVAALEVQLRRHIATAGNPIPRKRSAA